MVDESVLGKKCEEGDYVMRSKEERCFFQGIRIRGSAGFQKDVIREGVF